jgi:hypothetical protein
MQVSLTDRARWPWWLAAALGAASMAMWWQPWADHAVVPAPSAAATATPVPIAQRMPASDPSPPAAASTPAATPAPALKLVGTAVGGAGSFAIVRRTTDSQVLRLRVGDRVDGLAVTAIENDRVVLAGATQPVVIETDRTVAAPAAPVLSRAASPAPASKTEPQEWAEGEAPWDLAPPFKH